jgi:hypothetical protein
MSTLTHSAGRAARPGHVLELLTRGGFIGYGVLHLVFAWLALQIALGTPRDETDQSGAFRVLVRQPLGRPLVILVAIGLAAMALWQLFEAAVGHRDERGGRRVLERLVSVGRAVVYGALSWTAWRVQAGTGTSSAGSEQKATAGVLAHPAGRILIIIAGVVLMGIGVVLVVYGARQMFRKVLHTEQMGVQLRAVVCRFGQAGYVAKGVAYGIVGPLLISVAAQKNAAKSTGLDGALRTLAGKPYGELLLIVIAVGFLAFAVYCAFQARYRKVGV